MIKNIGVIGAGSVGSTLISYIYQADQEHLYLLAKGKRAERLKEKGISVNDFTMMPKVYSDKEQNIRLDLLIITVKTYSLEKVMDEIEDLISKDTIILPLQNGIMATERLQERFPDNRVLYGVMLRTDAHRTGHKVYFTTSGEIQIGYADNKVVKPEVQEIYECLKRTGINVHIYEDMKRTQWRKWMLNTGASQAAVEVGVECGFFEQVPEIVRLMQLCMDEILAVAKAEKVNITEKDRDEIIEMLLNFPAHKKMSMLQDVEAGRPIEIEEYAGTVIELGKRHQIPTPVNQVIYLAVKAREKVAEMRKHI